MPQSKFFQPLPDGKEEQLDQLSRQPNHPKPELATAGFRHVDWYMENLLAWSGTAKQKAIKPHNRAGFKILRFGYRQRVGTPSLVNRDSINVNSAVLGSPSLTWVPAHGMSE